MSKISEYPAAAALVATAKLVIFDPTNPTNPDQYITEAMLLGATAEAKNVEITIGAETANVRAVTIQLKDRFGANLSFAAVIRLIVFTTAAATALSTGGSTGLAIGANGLIILTEVAKIAFVVKSDDAGLITMTYTDTGTAAAFLGVQLPNGRIIMSAAMTNT